MLLNVVYFIQHKFSPVPVLCRGTQMVFVLWMLSFEVTVMSELALTLMRLFILLPQFPKNGNYMCVPPCLTDVEHVSFKFSSWD